MSRVIVKNFPKFVSEKDLQDHFKSIGQITDCRVIRDKPSNQSRRFGFIGFKDISASKEARKKFDNTYFGVSKIRVDFAKIQQTPNDKNKGKNQKKKIEKEKIDKFNQYKKVVMESAKKSWDDLVMPQQVQTVQKPKTKRQRVQQKRAKKATKQQQTYTPSENIKPIKAPKLSQKNKEFVKKPLAIDENRLYVTNIPFNLSEDELIKGFEKYGTITKIKLPVEYDGKTKGFAFVTYELPGEAMRAFHELDNKVMFGRILHIKPAIEDIGLIIRNAKEEEYEKKKTELFGSTPQQKTSYKKRKKKQMREKLNDTTSWNTLFLNPNTVLERMSAKLGITKSEILLSDNLAPKMSLAQAEVIQETKQWMISQSLSIDFLNIDRNACKRSQKVLLLKNLNFKVSEYDLQQLLGFYGIVNKLLLAPNRSLGIVEYQNGEFAKNALQKLQNSKFKNNFLYLEYAPIGMIKESEVEKKLKEMQNEQTQFEQLSKVIYIKNLNFSTDEASLTDFISKVEDPKSVSIIHDKSGKSMGYGFAEFQSNNQALKVIKQLQNKLLDGHRVMLSISKKRQQTHNYEKIKELKQKITKNQIKSNKLVVRNLAFQATKSQVKDLFKHFGSLKTVRLPKKLNGQHRGFCFVEFDTSEEAALAKQSLSSTHLYGRKFVIEYEKGTNEKTE